MRQLPVKLAGFLVGCAIGAPALALAMDEPDSAARGALQKRLGSAGIARVAGPAGAWLVARPRVEGDGLRGSVQDRFPTSRLALIQTPDASPQPAPPRLIPWNTISDIQTPRRAVLTGLVFGALTGLVLGGAFVRVFARPLSESSRSASGEIVALSAAAGGAAGLAIGATVVRWKSVLPVKR